MKRFYLINLIMILFCAQIWAFSTIIPTYIQVDTTISSQPSSFNGNIPSGPRRVHFVNHATELPKLELAMDEASKIFTASMLQNWFPMMDIYAEVSFDDLGPDSYIVCEVDVVYSDTIDNLENYPRLSSLMYGSSYNVLVPMANSPIGSISWLKRIFSFIYLLPASGSS